MKKKITNNLGLKILAILFSITLWLIVVNIDDPVKTVQFSGVEVKIMHSDDLTNQGKVYEVLDETNIITVTVKGRRSVIEDISKENISAVADLQDLTDMNTLTISLSANQYANEIDDLRSDTDTVKLQIEDLKKVQKVIEVEVYGEPADGYVLGNTSTNLNQVYLEGPESLISSVSYAKANLDVTGVSANISSSIPIRLYDADGKLIDDSRIKMNISTVSITQEVLVTKLVPINFLISGEAAEGYSSTGEVTADYSNILLAGKKSVIDKITEITVPEEILDISGMRSDLTKRIDMGRYLPNDVIFADPDFEGFVVATVNLEKETFISILFDEDNIEVVNVPNGMEAMPIISGSNLQDGEALLRVYGLADILSEIDVDHIKLTIDMKEYMEQNELSELHAGTYNVAPDFGFPSGAYLKEEFKVQVRLSN